MEVVHVRRLPSFRGPNVGPEEGGCMLENGRVGAGGGFGGKSKSAGNKM